MNMGELFMQVFEEEFSLERYRMVCRMFLEADEALTKIAQLAAKNEGGSIPSKKILGLHDNYVNKMLKMISDTE